MGAVQPVPVGNTSLGDLREVIRCLRGVKNWIETSSIYMFTPHPKQKLFFHPDTEQFPRFRVAHAGNRGGKSECGIIEDWAFAHGERPFDGSKTPLPVPNRGRIMTESYDLIKKNIERKIKSLWPKESIAEMKKGQQGQLQYVRFKNGSWVDFMSYEQDSGKTEGVDIDWLHMDEPPPRAHYIANIRGLVDRGGYWWMTSTPVKEPWVVDEIIEKCGKDPDYYLVEWSTYDNVGYGLTEKAVDTFKKTLSEAEITSRIYGKPISLQGLVYPEFRDHYWIPHQEDVKEAGGHIIKPFAIPASWPRFLGCDPHDRKPTHLVWFAVSDKDQIFIYDELKLPTMTVSKMADAIKSREASHINPADRNIYRVIDPASARRNNVLEVGSNIRDEFLRNQLYFYPAVNDIDAGHKKVREAFEFGMTMDGQKPRMLIFDTCTDVRYAFRRYLWAEWSSPKEAQSRDPKQKPRETQKDFPDCVRYVLMTNPRYFEPRKSQRKGYVPDNPRTGF